MVGGAHGLQQLSAADAIDKPAQLDEKNYSDASTCGSQIAVGRRKLHVKLTALSSRQQWHANQRSMAACWSRRDGR